MRRSCFVLLGAALAAIALSCGSEEGKPSGGSTGGGHGGPGGTGGATAASVTAGAATSSSSATGSGGGGPANNGFPAHWSDGLDCAKEPQVTVWPYDDDTFILRQSLCTNFEGNFLYLLFGEDKVLLEDTGTGAADVAGAVDGVITSWLAKKGKASIQLVVAHSHSHGDHVGGDGQFTGKANTTLVGLTVSAVQTFFGIKAWPTEIVKYDLGGRSLDVIPIPGHQKAHIALYDEGRALLLTGDTLYAGRLYISDWAAYGASTQRLVEFTSAPGHPVTWVLGTHVEMTTTPGQDYAMGATKHPSEHALELPLKALLELNQAVIGLGANPQYQKHDDFIIYPL